MLKKIEISNVMKFDHANLEFIDGINVLIGENGMGKTTILKMLYVAAKWSCTSGIDLQKDKLAALFSGNLKDRDLIKNKDKSEAFFEVSDENSNCRYTIEQKTGYFSSNQSWQGRNYRALYIPTMEMLSHSKGFLALNQKYRLPFDETQVDIIVNASLPEVREVPDYFTDILKHISKAIDGTIVNEDDRFYVLKENGEKIDFSLEAEGLRKLGLIWKLIRNGLLDENAILLWDEPEANINPELLPLVVEILLELEKAGVQIFIATHSYNLLKYFEIRRKAKEQVKYYSIFGQGEKTEYANAFYLSELRGNKIMDADTQLLDEALEYTMGE